ncbi:MAG: hypothetical protein DWQ37_03830 [Planctomycetota bacterium]|nr:MAG: hypothetical protein DWQ37_03830 [Planctomycetota bacterium]
MLLAVEAAADAEKKAEPLLMKLDPQRRAKVLMALLGLVLLGGFLMALVIMGGRQAMRAARKSHGPTQHSQDQWYRKPLVPGDGDRPAGDSK